MALSLGRLPRFLILEPTSTVRLELRLGSPACEIDVELENPKPDRSFLLLIGPAGGPVLQRMRLNGRARIVFEPKDERTHVLMLANPQKEPLVLRLRGRPVKAPARVAAGRPPRAGTGRKRSRSEATGRAGARRSPRRVSAAPRVG